MNKYSITTNWIIQETINKYLIQEYKKEHKARFNEAIDLMSLSLYTLKWIPPINRVFWGHEPLHLSYPLRLRHQWVDDLRRHAREVTGKKRLSRLLTKNQVIGMILKA